MFCPKCGQQQVSDEMRFCSRCGFQLGVVSTLIATGGVPPAINLANDSGDANLKAKRGAKRGAKLMFASVVLTPITVGLGLLLESPEPLLIAFTIFLAGLAWRLYYQWFGEGTSLTDRQSSPTQLQEARQVLLPPSQPPLITDIRSHDTAEMIKPPSVTERTTKLLDPEQGPSAATGQEQSRERNR